jgi:hypothetical protein
MALAGYEGRFPEILCKAAKAAPKLSRTTRPATAIRIRYDCILSSPVKSAGRKFNIRLFQRYCIKMKKLSRLENPGINATPKMGNTILLCLTFITS